MHTGWRQRNKKEEWTGRNTWYSGWISLCIQPERDTSVGFGRIWSETQTTSLDSAENDLARSRRNFMGFKNLALHLRHSIFSTLSRRPDLAVLSRSRHSCESTNWKRKDHFDPKQIQKSAVGLSFGRLGFTFSTGASEGLYAIFAWGICDVGFRSASFCYASQSASFSLNAFKSSIVFQSTAKGVELCHLITYEFSNYL